LVVKFRENRFRGIEKSVGGKKIKRLEAEDVLPGINRTQAAERPANVVFCPW